MTFKPAKNTSSGPVVIDDDGHTLGGGETGPVDPGSDRVRDAVEHGLMVVLDDDGPAERPAAHRSKPSEEKS